MTTSHSETRDAWPFEVDVVEVDETAYLIVGLMFYDEAGKQIEVRATFTGGPEMLGVYETLNKSLNASHIGCCVDGCPRCC